MEDFNEEKVAEKTHTTKSMLGGYLGAYEIY